MEVKLNIIKYLEKDKPPTNISQPTDRWLWVLILTYSENRIMSHCSNGTQYCFYFVDFHISGDLHGNTSNSWGITVYLNVVLLGDY